MFSLLTIVNRFNETVILEELLIDWWAFQTKKLSTIIFQHKYLLENVITLRLIISPLKFNAERGKFPMQISGPHLLSCLFSTFICFLQLSVNDRALSDYEPWHISYLPSIVLKSTAATITALNQQLFNEDGQMCCQAEA